MTDLFLHIPCPYIPAYFIFFSALIVTIRSDIETMLISRYVTLFLVPIGVACAYLNLLPITFTESSISCVTGSGLLWVLGKIFYRITGKEGIGQGDIDLLAFIGAFIGLIGIWFTVLLGSILGSTFGLVWMLASHDKKSIRIPFGPFLAASAMVYVLYAYQVIPFLIG
jgi:leader peptidase (prepilin peptidase)/N-methyltransferase